MGAKQRCYSDPRAKAELLVALTRFELLAGVRPLDEMQAALEEVPEIATLLPPMRELGVHRWVEAYLTLADAPVLAALQHWVARDEGLVARMHRRLGSAQPDRGLVFGLLLQPLTLHPGQAVYIAPGLLHAYLEGTALEIAGNSDNVLRAGLTEKHVDPAELLRVVRWEASPTRQTSATSGAFACDADAFRLHLQRVSAGQRLRHIANGPETVLALPRRADVCVRISWREGEMELRRGHACLVPHGVAYELESTGRADVYRAVVPV